MNPPPGWTRWAWSPSWATSGTVDRLVVVNDGKIPFQGTPRQVFQHGDELEAMGLGVPQLTRVFHRLRAMGADVDPSVYTLEQAKAALLDRLGRAGKGAV